MDTPTAPAVVTPELCDLAEGQFGHITVAQAAKTSGEGTAEHLVTAGVAEAITDTVIRIRAGGHHSHPRLYAAWLSLEPETPAWERQAPDDGVLSHASAVLLYGAALPLSPIIEFTKPSYGNYEDDSAETLGDTRIYSKADGCHWRDVDGIPTTTPAQTLVDLAHRLDPDELARIAATIVAGGWITADALHTDLQNRADSYETDIRLADDSNISHAHEPLPDGWARTVMGDLIVF